MTETIEILFENEKIRVEKIRSFGQTNKKDFWYDNACDEWVSITQGNAVLRLENDKKIALNTDDNYYIKAGEKHRVDFTSPDCEWLCVYIK